ncbi:PTS sugar transporter subunit IIA [Phyllobacterium sp. 21LDTY02-6]|jgi:galactitol PTS system EIIA component|uniref:PTS sugar transporter subunit IIA n=1 Tax=unclassified Phyllobacterium TaxID=2638441 RepID=UPI00201FD7C2|nr:MULTISPECIES: PTS sugar transporter subunit IIA [unclassified Phyllobacterium]MCO4319811.1 PTS sugar transporter subunit IIA [Phyllobacterium sp. 21LDTY02-6]MCX8280551.1 PTS sugar transporter subunit IIA [Phyllobacterium sp. 0TCS1.6C]MCX8295000.1 PTS sugar transporter subunit IIA [Phyllobacterium sp. 0TCS1.6A]
MAQALIEHLDPGAILLGVRAASDREVIELLAERLFALGYVRESYGEAVLAREASLPTGLPLGADGNVAVPHTDPEHVLKAGIAFASLAEPVEFANMENPEEKLKVRLVFLMALNDKDKQIELLQEIAGTIQSPELIAALGQAKSTQDVLQLLR